MSATYVGSAGVGMLAADLRALPAEARRELRPALRAAGQIVRDAAAQEASWSARIPASLQVVTSAVSRRSSVAIVARQQIAPHARPLEGIAGNASFRHPVFGMDTWVAQACRPFMRPAAAAKQPAVVELIGDAVHLAIARNHWTSRL